MNNQPGDVPMNAPRIEIALTCTSYDETSSAVQKVYVDNALEALGLARGNRDELEALRRFSCEYRALVENMLADLSLGRKERR